MKIGRAVAEKLARRRKATSFRCRMWHVAPKRFRAEIAQAGLRCFAFDDGEGKPELRAYLWDDLKAACWFKAYHDYNGGDSDIWEVDTEGLPLFVDPEACDMNFWSPSVWKTGESGHAFYTMLAIPANRVRGPVRVCKE